MGGGGGDAARLAKQKYADELRQQAEDVKNRKLAEKNALAAADRAADEANKDYDPFGRPGQGVAPAQKHADLQQALAEQVAQKQAEKAAIKAKQKEEEQRV